MKGSASVFAGGEEIIASVTGDECIVRKAENFKTFWSISGFTTLVTTGSWESAETAASIEDIGMIGFGGAVNAAAATPGALSGMAEAVEALEKGMTPIDDILTVTKAVVSEKRSDNPKCGK